MKAFEQPAATDRASAHEELQVIVDAIPALIFYKDAGNRVLRVNRAVKEALNLTTAMAASRELERYFLADGGLRDRADLEAIRTGKAQPSTMELIHLPRLGPRWFETVRLPQFDAQGNVVGLVVVSQDITERKRLEDQLRQAQKLESIGKLAGGVAHDFNNMLTSLFGLITAAQRCVPPDSMVHEYLALMRLAGEGGANLTRQLLSFARREIIEPRVVDLNELIRETLALLSRVLDAHITLTSELYPDAVAIRADTSQISQLLLNLALNARDAMPQPGTLTFATALVELDAPQNWGLQSPNGHYALLTVKDTGEGLSEEVKEHLFEPFFTSKALGHGTGLGLATCYGIVKQHRGHITVESERGHGTKFSIYLPQAEAPLEAPNRTTPTDLVRVGNETVLFVEDDDVVRYLSVAALASSGYRMIEANHGEEALNAARQHSGPIHLLVTDVIMPKMGGPELVQRLREFRPETKVLYITGYAGEAMAELGGTQDILRKPFTNDALLRRIRDVLDRCEEIPGV